MKNWRINKLEKQFMFERTYYCILLISCIIMMLGMTFNFIVITENGGKMPVYWDNNYSDADHFSFQNLSEVEHPYYSDMIQIYNSIYSIGDIIMLFAVTIVILTAIIFIFIPLMFRLNRYFKNKRRKNEKEKIRR